MSDPANQLPAIASTGAPTDLVRFEQHHAQAAFGQFDGGIEARKAAAHHAHITVQLALQGRVRRLPGAVGSVVGSGMHV
ncbi:hypothetical protein D3C77_735500 [compost metagenome]